MKKEDERVYVCKRIADWPDLVDETAVKGNCEECKAPIWHKCWAPTSMPKICWHCAVKQIDSMDPDDEVQILPGRAAIQ